MSILIFLMLFLNFTMFFDTSEIRARKVLEGLLPNVVIYQEIGVEWGQSV